MCLLRWLSVALMTLATTSALHAQTTPFSVLGLTSLFGQETAGDANTSVLPWLPLPTGSILGVNFDFSAADDGEEAEDLPAPRRCEISLMPTFVPECLKCWKEQWRLGNFREAEMLATIACRLEPANIAAQHALALSELMQGLTGNRDASEACSAPQAPVALGVALGQAVFGIDMEITSAPRTGTGSKPCASCAVPKACCKEAGCCAGAGTAKSCCAAQKTQAGPSATKSCPCAPKPDCCCTKAATTASQACPCDTPKPECCCAKKAREAAACACACCKNSVPARQTRSIMMPPVPFRVMGEVANADSCPFLVDLRDLVFVAPQPTPAPLYVSESDFAQATPMRLPPPPGFTPGMTPPLPSLAQVFHDLECVRSAAINNVRASSPPVDMAGRSNVHLVTPHFEAHCERLTNAGNPDHLLLEGDVRLTCNRNGQTLRIQGQRVHVHLSDGTFTVESMTPPRSPEPARRVRLPAPPVNYYQPATYTAPPVPWGSVRPVRPSDDATDYVPYKPVPWGSVRPVRPSDDAPDYVPYKPED